jgi:hypothetical protein
MNNKDRRSSSHLAFVIAAAAVVGCQGGSKREDNKPAGQTEGFGGRDDKSVKSKADERGTGGIGDLPKDEKVAQDQAPGGPAPTPAPIAPITAPDLSKKAAVPESACDVLSTDQVADLIHEPVKLTAKPDGSCEISPTANPLATIRVNLSSDQGGGINSIHALVAKDGDPEPKPIEFDEARGFVATKTKNAQVSTHAAVSYRGVIAQTVMQNGKASDQETNEDTSRNLLKLIVAKL